MSLFDKVDTAPPDPILGVTTAFRADTSPQKVNLGVGAYRDDNGKPWVLDVVRKIEQEMANSKDLEHEYVPSEGFPDFVKLTAQLILGKDSKALKEGRVATVQALSGTGALRLGAGFIKKYFPEGTVVYVSKPTWSNHFGIMASAGIQTREYRYFDEKTLGLDYEGFIADLRAAPQGAVILLHACAHNPTGVDPTPSQWAGIAEVLKERNLFPFFDSAYQGFASGDLDADAHAVRLFEDRGFEMFVTQSYAKNLGLYGERVGAISVVCSSSKPVAAVTSQLRILVRTMYSSPPSHGAKIAAAVLGQPENFNAWLTDLKTMSGRIKAMRQALVNRLRENGTPGNWDHITNQIGMFSYTGLNSSQVDILINKWHIYLVSNGRISMAGINTKNVNYVADAIKDAVLSTRK